MTIAQSATWYGSQFDGAWAICRVLWPDLGKPKEVADRSFWRWVYEWCETEYDHFATNNKRIVGEKNPGRLVDSVPCYINLRSAQGDITFTDVYVDLLPAQRKLYRQMEETSVAWLRDNPLVAEFPITQRIRLRQLTLAEAIIDDDGVVNFEPDAKSSKLDALVDMLKVFGDEKVLVATDSAKFAEIVAERIGGFAWVGARSQHEREEARIGLLKVGCNML
jgi:hypothetical protein